jgi:hypothetical protein
VEDKYKLWSSVGSAGTVDVADQQNVIFYNSIVQLGAASPGGIISEASIGPPPVVVNAVVRYDVTPVDGVFQGPEDIVNFTLRLRYRDGDGWLVARFIVVVIDTGVEVEYVRFDTRGTNLSGAPLGGNNNFVTNIGQAPSWGPIPLDFVDNTCYIELTLSAVIYGNRPLAYPPAVSVIQLWPTPGITYSGSARPPAKRRTK